MAAISRDFLFFSQIRGIVSWCSRNGIGRKAFMNCIRRLTRIQRFTLLALLFTATVIPSARAETLDSPIFSPVTPEVTAQGSSFTAIAEGYNSLYTNPAGFARGEGDFTLLSTQGSSYFVPTKKNRKSLSNVRNGEADSNLRNLITDNGFGLAGTGGIGYVGHNFGLGASGSLDVYGRDDSGGRESEVNVVYTWGIVGGIAYPFQLGPVTLSAGGDLRYMLRTEMRGVGLVEFMESEGDIPMDALSGEAIALDGGIIGEYGPLSLGFAMRDIGGTDFGYRSTGVDNLDEALTHKRGKGEESDDVYRIPMSTHLGLAYHPDLGELSRWLDPKIHAEYRKVWYAQERSSSLWRDLHLGAEIETLRFFKLRAGVNEGYFTAGAGMHLLFLDVNFAYFARETESYGGSEPNRGVTLEAAVRF